MFKKQLESKFNSLVQTMPENYGQTASFELEFVSNFQVRRPALRLLLLIIVAVCSPRPFKQACETLSATCAPRRTRPLHR